MVNEQATALRVVGTNEYQWTYTNVRIGKDEADDFEILANHRDLRQGHINKIYRALCNGEHFESGLVVNKKGRKYRLIDGNHRMSAIRKFLEKFPDRHVRVALHVYDDLTEEEEKDKFNTWNKGLKQSTNDYIKQYWDDVRVFHKLQKPFFPVDVHYVWVGNKMEVRMFLNSYFGTKTSTYRGYASTNGELFIKMAQELSAEDVTLLKAFMLDYVAVFGEPNKQGTFYHAVIFSAAMDVWVRNAQTVSAPEMSKRMKKMLRNTLVTSWQTKQISFDNCVLCRRDMVEVMNKGVKKNLVV